MEEVVEPQELWEEVANAVLWTIPFGFLYAGMDFAVHSQYGVDLTWSRELLRLRSAIPPIFLLSFIAPRMPALPLQFLLLALCLLSGISLIHLTSRESYLKVMRQAPGYGVLWVWSVVKLDLGWGVLGLMGVAAGVWWNGDLEKVWGR